MEDDEFEVWGGGENTKSSLVGGTVSVLESRV